MLQLLHICKSYKTADFSQIALDNVSVAFRDSEFVAILGPSGSGKTTLLNIIGGLDQYNSGNLVIDGISTKQYKDRDWDTYRNNRIGFVFQSYNLIPHQTILANVELALTLSGVSREERKKRAIDALDQVGLKEHINKRPSQLSGGQMQRVAIARALINDPEILLADEPTGALDSKTSVQIMDLLTQIAHDRLVIMVTHNPDLADEYATRIVTLTDGVICSDTNPFNPALESLQESTKQVRRTSMSFFTALALSFNNLMTKKGRTIMTSFAGSIGIIGIAAILALANGVSNYIQTVEEETLSEYPLEIMSSGFDITSMMMMGMPNPSEETNTEGDEKTSRTIAITEVVTNIASSLTSNDLASLKKYLDSDESNIEQYTNAIEYSYDVTPQIFSQTEEYTRQVNPDTSFSSLGLSSGASSNSLMSMSMSTDVFYELPSSPLLYEDQYDVLAGQWPSSYDEVVLVLTGSGSMADQLLYTMGLRNPHELDEMVKKFAAEEEVEVPHDLTDPTYDEILDVTFKLVNASDYYSYDKEYNVWTNKQDNADYMKNLVASSKDVTIVGIVQPKEDASATMLTSGIYYLPSMTTQIVTQAKSSEIVKDQLANPTLNVITGTEFGAEEETSAFDMTSLFTIDEHALQAAIVIDENALSIDLSNALNLTSATSTLPSVPTPDMNALMSQIHIDEALVGQVSGLMSSYMQDYADYLTSYPPLIENPDYDPSNPSLAPEFIENPIKALSASDWLNQPDIQASFTASLATIVGESNLTDQISTALQSYVSSTLTIYMGAMAAEMQTQMTAALQSSMNQMSSNMANAFSIDATAFENAFVMNLTEDELSELMMSMMSTEESSYDNNLTKFGYANFDEPSAIDIYPIDFESKEHVIAILDAYNDEQLTQGNDDKVISYTDMVGTLMSSVTTIVNMISYVLIAFVAISLVVSSIMIGVITYISVLERKKEIGILRSIGASKGDIARVFNAETIIVGLLAGLIGVGATALICIPANAIVYSLFDVPNVALLPINAAVILVLISIVLTFLGGLAPSSAASRKDPVEALRSE